MVGKKIKYLKMSAMGYKLFTQATLGRQDSGQNRAATYLWQIVNRGGMWEDGPTRDAFLAVNQDLNEDHWSTYISHFVGTSEGWLIAEYHIIDSIQEGHNP